MHDDQNFGKMSEEYMITEASLAPSSLAEIWIDAKLKTAQSVPEETK